MTHITPNTLLSMNFWTFELLELYPFLPWQPDYFHFSLWKKPTQLTNQHPSFVYWAWPITTNLPGILPLHKANGIKNSESNARLYKSCLFCFFWRTIEVASWKCVLGCNPLHCSNKCILFFNIAKCFCLLYLFIFVNYPYIFFLIAGFPDRLLIYSRISENNAMLLSHKQGNLKTRLNVVGLQEVHWVCNTLNVVT